MHIFSPVSSYSPFNLNKLILELIYDVLKCVLFPVQTQNSNQLTQTGRERAGPFIKTKKRHLHIYVLSQTECLKYLYIFFLFFYNFPFKSTL